MKMRINTLPLFIGLTLLLFSASLSAQHEQQYTQFMFNKGVINPGFVGALGDLTFTGIYRNQWMGFEGAPTAMGLSVDGALKSKKIGLGLNIFRHNISIYDTWTIDAQYAYKIQLGPEARLSAGLQASMRYYGVNFLDPRLRGSQDIGMDGAIPGEDVNSYIPNFGFGLYFSTKTFFTGISIPRLLTSNLDFNDKEVPLSRESRHAYLMVGGSVKLNQDLELTPQALLKYVNNAPLSYEINTNLMIAKRYMFGLSYRSGGASNQFGESVDVLFGFQITNPLFIGFSYDILLSEIRQYSSGSIEAVIRYQLIRESEDSQRMINPRYF